MLNKENMLKERAELKEKMDILKEKYDILAEKYDDLDFQISKVKTEYKDIERKFYKLDETLKQIKKVELENDKNANIYLFMEELCILINGEPYNDYHGINWTDCVVFPDKDIFYWKEKGEGPLSEDMKEKIFELMRKRNILMMIMETSYRSDGCRQAHNKKFFTSWADILK